MRPLYKNVSECRDSTTDPENLSNNSHYHHSLFIWCRPNWVCLLCRQPTFFHDHYSFLFTQPAFFSLILFSLYLYEETRFRAGYLSSLLWYAVKFHIGFWLQGVIRATQLTRPQHHHPRPVGEQSGIQGNDYNVQYLVQAVRFAAPQPCWQQIY